MNKVSHFSDGRHLIEKSRATPFGYVARDYYDARDRSTPIYTIYGNELSAPTYAKPRRLHLMVAILAIAFALSLAIG